MSPQGFSLVFGCISLGLVAAAQGGARIAVVWPHPGARIGPVAAPFVSIAGEQTAVPLGIVTTAVSMCAMASFVA